MLFAAGSFLFGLGVVPAYLLAVGGLPDAATFFAGSLFFTSAGFLQYREAVDALPERKGDAGRKDAGRRKVFVFRPRQIDWLATGVQLIGTLAFNVSTGVAMWAAAGTAQARHHVWRPDAVGSACFLIASGLAWFEVCHGWAAWRPRSLAWWVTGVNLAGSVAFGFSAVASFVIPGRSKSSAPRWPTWVPSPERSASSQGPSCCCSSEQRINRSRRRHRRCRRSAHLVRFKVGPISRIRQGFAMPAGPPRSAGRAVRSGALPVPAGSPPARSRRPQAPPGSPTPLPRARCAASCWLQVPSDVTRGDGGQRGHLRVQPCHRPV